MFYSKLFSPAPSIAYIFHLGFNVYLPGILGIRLVLAFTRYQAMIYYAAVHYPAFLDVLRLPHISWYFTASFSPAPSFHSLHFSFGFQLPSRHSWPIDSLGPSFHSLPIYDLLCSCALPSVFRCFEITSHFMVFYSKLFTCPFHSLHFSFGFQRLPSRDSWPIDSLGPSFHSLRSYALPSVFRCF